MLRMLLSDHVSRTTSLTFDCAFVVVFVMCIGWMIFQSRKRQANKQNALPRALTIKSWEVKEAIPQIVSYLKSSETRVCVVRKRKCLDKFISKVQQEGDYEIAQALVEAQKMHQAIITPVDDSGEEDWDKAKIIIVETDADDLMDGFMVADTGRVAEL